MVDTRDFAGRTALLPIQTLTLTDRQFLIGDGNGKPTTIAGQLRIAQGLGRLPTVVLQHGSNGFGPGIEYWSRQLNAAGISTFALDGFTGRGTRGSLQQSGPARPSQFHPGHLSRARDPCLPCARRPSAYRLDGLLTRRTGRALRQPQEVSRDVEYVRGGICRVRSILPRLRDHVYGRHRHREPADPNLSRRA
jgi:hypothetical protein